MAGAELVPITREFLAEFYKEHEIGPVSEDVVRLINTLEVTQSTLRWPKMLLVRGS